MVRRGVAIAIVGAAAVVVALGTGLGIGLRDDDATPTPTPTPTSVSGLSGAAKTNALKAALTPRKVTMIPSEGVSTTSSGSSRIDGRSLVEVTPLDVSSFSSTSDYATAPAAETFVDAVSTEIFQTPNMVLCYIASVNWTANLNTGPYIAEIDPFHCDNSDGDRIKGKVTYRWVVNATGPDIDDVSDTRDFKANVWAAFNDNKYMPNIDGEMAIKRDDVAVKSDKIVVKSMSLTYQSPTGSSAPQLIKGVIRRECETTNADSDCTATGVTWWEEVTKGGNSFTAGAKSRAENDVTKASFQTIDFSNDSPQTGKLVTTATLVKTDAYGQSFCDKLENRSFFGERYGAYDSNGAKVNLQSYAELQATGSDSNTYNAFMNYPGNLYISDYDYSGTALSPAEKTIAQAAFADGSSVVEIVDWNDPTLNVNKKLKISRGVLYRLTATVQSASDYQGATITSWFWDKTHGLKTEVKFKYDADASALVLSSKRTWNTASGALRANSITTPRALTMADIDNQVIHCWGSIFGQGSASLLNLTHFKVSDAQTVAPGSLSSDLTLTCGERCIDQTQLSSVSESSYDSQFYGSPNGYNDVRNTYKKYVFDKDTGSLKEDVSGNLGAEVVMDPTNSFFDSHEVHMVLFEATNDNLATLSCTATAAICEHPHKLDVHYEWRSSNWAGMAWLEDPSNSASKKFMDAPLHLQGKMPTGAVLLRSPSGTDYSGVNLNVRYEGGWVSDAPFVCFNPMTGQRKSPEVDSYGNEYCDYTNGYYRRPDVLIPDGTTFKQPSTGDRYVLKLESGVEMLAPADASACSGMSYDTSITVPTVADYTAFTMPTKPSMTGLSVKGTDKVS